MLNIERKKKKKKIFFFLLLSILFLPFTLPNWVFGLSLNISNVFSFNEKNKSLLFFYLLVNTRHIYNNFQVRLREPGGPRRRLAGVTSTELRSLQTTLFQPGLACCCVPQFTPIPSVLEYSKHKLRWLLIGPSLPQHSHRRDSRGSPAILEDKKPLGQQRPRATILNTEL